MTAILPAVLIDAHHHFWTDNTHFRAVDYLPENYLEDCAPLRDRVCATVFVECGTHYDMSQSEGLQPIGETRFAAAIGDAHDKAAVRLAAAIVGHADPLVSDVPFGEIVDAHIEAGGGRLRALRRSVAWDVDPRFVYPVLKTQANMLIDDRFVRAAQIMATRDIAFETWLFHPQLGELEQLSRLVPECTIILDHAGTPLTEGDYENWDRTWGDWQANMAKLAEQPNVHVKMGGLIGWGSRLDRLRQEAGLESWTVPALTDALRPWLSHLITHFGAERCMFESNFPVDREACTWEVLVRAYAEALSDVDTAGREALFSGTAARLYRIDPRPVGSET